VRTRKIPQLGNFTPVRGPKHRNYGPSRGEGPGLYPVACSPQAWAAGAVFLLVQACLGVSIQGAISRILFDRPYLPEGSPQLGIKGLRTSTGSADVFFERRNDNVRVEVTDQKGEIEVSYTKTKALVLVGEREI
jgi:hypothetical protein